MFQVLVDSLRPPLLNPDLELELTCGEEANPSAAHQDLTEGHCNGGGGPTPGGGPLQHEDPASAEKPGADQDVTMTAPAYQTETGVPIGRQGMAQLRDKTRALIAIPQVQDSIPAEEEAVGEAAETSATPGFQRGKRRRQRQEQLWKVEELRVAIQSVVEANCQARLASPFGTPFATGRVQHHDGQEE